MDWIFYARSHNNRTKTVIVEPTAYRYRTSIIITSTNVIHRISRRELIIHSHFIGLCIWHQFDKEFSLIELDNYTPIEYNCRISKSLCTHSRPISNCNQNRDSSTESRMTTSLSLTHDCMYSSASNCYWYYRDNHIMTFDTHFFRTEGSVRDSLFESSSSSDACVMDVS